MKQWLQMFTGSPNYPTGCALMSAQVRLVTTLVGGLSVFGFRVSRQYNFFQLWVLSLHRSQGGQRASDQSISFSKCCRRPDRCTERLPELYTSVTAVRRKRRNTINVEVGIIWKGLQALSSRKPLLI